MECGRLPLYHVHHIPFIALHYVVIGITFYFIAFNYITLHCIILHYTWHIAYATLFYPCPNQALFRMEINGVDMLR